MFNVHVLTRFHDKTSSDGWFGRAKNIDIFLDTASYNQGTYFGASKIEATFPPQDTFSQKKNSGIRSFTSYFVVVHLTVCDLPKLVAFKWSPTSDTLA